MNKPILIVAEELKTALREPRTVVIDCRFDLADPAAGRRDYEQAHVPGAVFLDLDSDLAGPIGRSTGRHPLPDPEVLSRTLGKLGISRSHDLVVYDHGHGGIAARAWWTLRWLGHDAVRLLDGGLAGWSNLGLPVESGATHREAVAFEPNVRNELVLTIDELLTKSRDIEAMNLFDARDAARFRGEHEPIDPVAGHIPGTRSLPFTEFVSPDGTWLPIEKRAARILDALKGNRDADWSVMCGSGVTACHLAISGVEGGFREPKVYVGSWSEWIRDPARPIAKGGG